MGMNFKSLSEVHVKQPAKTQGFRTRRGFRHTFEAAVDAETPKRSCLDITFPYAIDLSQGDYYLPTADWSPGTRLWVESPANLSLDLVAQSVGYPASSAGLGAAVVAGDTTITLNPLAAAMLGAVLTDGVSKKQRKQEIYFRLASIPGDPTDFSDLREACFDAATGQLMDPYGNAFGLTGAVGDDIFITLRFEDGAYLAAGSMVRMGDDSLDSSHIPGGTLIRLVIENTSLNPLDVFFNLTYYKD